MHQAHRLKQINKDWHIELLLETTF